MPLFGFMWILLCFAVFFFAAFALLKVETSLTGSYEDCKKRAFPPCFSRIAAFMFSSVCFLLYLSFAGHAPLLAGMSLASLMCGHYFALNEKETYGRTGLRADIAKKGHVSEQDFAPFVVSFVLIAWIGALFTVTCGHHHFPSINIIHNTLSVIFGVTLYAFCVYGSNGIKRVKAANNDKCSFYDILASVLVAPVLAYKDIRETLKQYTLGDFMFFARQTPHPFAMFQDDEAEVSDAAQEKAEEAKDEAEPKQDEAASKQD